MPVALGPILVVVTFVGCTMAHLVAVGPDPVAISTERAHGRPHAMNLIQESPAFGWRS